MARMVSFFTIALLLACGGENELGEVGDGGTEGIGGAGAGGSGGSGGSGGTAGGGREEGPSFTVSVDYPDVYGEVALEFEGLPEIIVDEGMAEVCQPLETPTADEIAWKAVSSKGFRWEGSIDANGDQCQEIQLVAPAITSGIVGVSFSGNSCPLPVSVFRDGTEIGEVTEAWTFNPVADLKEEFSYEMSLEYVVRAADDGKVAVVGVTEEDGPVVLQGPDDGCEFMFEWTFPVVAIDISRF